MKKISESTYINIEVCGCGEELIEKTRLSFRESVDRSKNSGWTGTASLEDRNSKRRLCCGSAGTTED